MPNRLLFEYRPPAAHPIVYAGMLLFAVVLVTGSLENLAREQRPMIYAAYAAPLVATVLFFLLMRPNTTRIYMDGIAPARPWLTRALRLRPAFVPWADLEAVYPSFYDVTGAFVSPFASSDGKVTQMGLGLAWPTGKTETVRFTPTRFEMFQSRSAGYAAALDAVRYAFSEAGRPLVAEGETIPREQQAALLDEAGRPFLPFFAIVLLFASAAPLLFVFTRLGMPVWLALPLCIIPPVAVSLRSYRQSQQRHRILDRLSRAAEYRRSKSGGPS